MTKKYTFNIGDSVEFFDQHTDKWIPATIEVVESSDMRWPYFIRFSTNEEYWVKESELRSSKINRLKTLFREE